MSDIPLKKRCARKIVCIVDIYLLVLADSSHHRSYVIAVYDVAFHILSCSGNKKFCER